MPPAPETPPQHPAFTAKIQSIVQSFASRLVSEQTTLYRRKADIINLLAQLVPHVKSRTERINILRIFVQHWRDPDSEVRVTAIKMVQYLGESGIPEVMECLNENMPKPAPGQEPLPNIMQELSALMSHPEYGEKDQLQDFLKWRFSQLIQTPPQQTPPASAQPQPSKPKTSTMAQ
ncbi:hypothetical protein HDV00_003856 [Rhizophlyctis rosea]|nr:hypothetical protein HDV00_003856 [Rhizophlyctis rosea]